MYCVTCYLWFEPHLLGVEGEILSGENLYQGMGKSLMTWGGYNCSSPVPEGQEGQIVPMRSRDA